MKEFLKYIISQIVNHPEEVTIDENKFGDNIFQYHIKVNQEDIGQIIGKEGKIIKAIRNIAKVLAVKESKQVRIEIG